MDCIISCSKVSCQAHPENCWFIINQSNFYSANIPGEARLSGATAKSVFNSKFEGTVP